MPLEDKSKALQIGDQAQVRAEMWLFDPTYPVGNSGITELSSQITTLLQSIMLFIVQ